jgi:DNA polymerase I
MAGHQSAPRFGRFALGNLQRKLHPALAYAHGLGLHELERGRIAMLGPGSRDEPTYRHEALPSYQSGREFEDDIVEQLEVLPEFVSACGFANAKAAGYEADDFLAAAVAKEEKRGGTAVVATGDRDAFQLASARTIILQPVKAGELARIGPAAVLQRYGVEPAQVPDFIALRGDASDRIPGALGVGPKTAAALLRRHGSLDALLKAGRFERQAKELRLYRSIATMDKSAPLPALHNQTPTWDRAGELAHEWGLNKLAARLVGLSQASQRRRSKT